jgi:hypothetical protein
MGQLTGGAVDTRSFKEVFEYQTYIYTTLGNETLRCNKCANLFKKGDRITYLLTNTGMEYYHEGKCLKGTELISAHIT